MNNAVSAPTISIRYALEEDTKCGPGSITVDSSSLMDWREPIVQESPSDLSTTCGDEFSDDGSGFQTAYSSETSVQPEAPSWTHLWQDYRRLSRDMQRTSMSNVSPFNQHQYTEAEVRGRRLLAIPPSGRSRSTPRRPQVAAIQIRRVASTHNPRGPLPFLDTAFVNTPGGAVSPFASSSSSDSGHDPFAYGSDTYPYGNVVDHDQHSSPLGDPDRTPTLHTWVSPINDEDGHGGGFSVSANSHWYPWALPDSGACRPGSPRTDNFLTGGDCQPHWSSAYEDLVTPQSSFGTFPSEPHNNNMVSNFGSDSIIDPSSASARSGVELKRVLPLDTGDTSTSQILQRSPGSRRPRKFRTNVGSMAMAEACKKRRKRRDGALFVCEVQGCSGTFTARHNLRYHMKSHNDIRDEICGDCGADFVTRETRRRHQRTCNGIKKRSRH